jgi:hypothetical protein
MLVGIFEQHPWMLIPLVIVINEGWTALKKLATKRFRNRTIL